MTRRQVRRMIRHESVITALIGAALGLRSASSWRSSTSSYARISGVRVNA
jgi:ABC-type antimicrobial peptide transport system permease subunit